MIHKKKETSFLRVALLSPLVLSCGGVFRPRPLWVVVVPPPSRGAVSMIGLWVVLGTNHGGKRGKRKTTRAK